eukprot:4020635-Prymnesium_polylepis.2
MRLEEKAVVTMAVALLPASTAPSHCRRSGTGLWSPAAAAAGHGGQVLSGLKWPRVVGAVGGLAIVAAASSEHLLGTGGSNARAHRSRSSRGTKLLRPRSSPAWR